MRGASQAPRYFLAQVQVLMAEAILLGVAQDGGVPQAGCGCPRCSRALKDPREARHVVCLGVVDRPARKFWLIDATPDFPVQLGRLASYAMGCSLAGIFLTHAHIGHYSGLVYLGPEALNASGLPLFCSSRMETFLCQNEPWSGLIAQGHVVVNGLEPGMPLPLTEGSSLLPIAVPHRDEHSDTLAFLLQGPRASLFYCPDIDSWDAWDQDVGEFFRQVDIALLDATFFDRTELPGRDLREIPHPLAREYPGRFASLETQVFLVHLNHTNPLLEESSQRAWLEARGMYVGQEGLRWLL